MVNIRLTNDKRNLERNVGTFIHIPKEIGHSARPYIYIYICVCVCVCVCVCEISAKIDPKRQNRYRTQNIKMELNIVIY